MIGVIGADGDLGWIVLEDLLTKVPGDEIRAVVSDPATVEPYRSSRNVDIRAADPDDPPALRRALTDVETLMILPSPRTGTGVHHGHAAVVDAAVAADVGRAVLVSALHDDAALLASCGLPVTVLRTTCWAETLVNAELSQVVADGVLRGADMGRPVNWVGMVDIAVAASEAATGDEHAGRVHEIRGPLWTLPQLAGILAEVSGRPVVHLDVPASELGSDGPLHELIAAGAFAEAGDDLPALLGRPAMPLAQLVADALTGGAVRRTD